MHLFLAFLPLLPLEATSGISNKLALILNLEINLTPELIHLCINLKQEKPPSANKKCLVHSLPCDLYFAVYTYRLKLTINKYIKCLLLKQ